MSTIILYLLNFVLSVVYIYLYISYYEYGEPK